MPDRCRIRWLTLRAKQRIELCGTMIEPGTYRGTMEQYSTDADNWSEPTFTLDVPADNMPEGFLTEVVWPRDVTALVANGEIAVA